MYSFVNNPTFANTSLSDFDVDVRREVAQVAADVKKLDEQDVLARIAQVDDISDTLGGHIDSLTLLVSRLTVSS